MLNFFTAAKRDDASPFPVAQIVFAPLPQPSLQLTETERSWSSGIWENYIRKGIGASQRLRELPLAGIPAFILLRALELLLGDDINMLDNQRETFVRLKDTIIQQDYNTAESLFTTGVKDATGKLTSRYHNIVTEPTFCYNQKLYLIGDEDVQEIKKYLQSTQDGDPKKLFFYDCFDAATAAKLQHWGQYIISWQADASLPGINRNPVDLKSQILELSSTNSMMENDLISTLRLDHFLYCRTFDGLREVGSPVMRKSQHSLCDMSLKPPKQKKVSKKVRIQVVEQKNKSNFFKMLDSFLERFTSPVMILADFLNPRLL